MKKEKSKEIDFGKDKVSSIFWKIWVPTIIAQIIAGTFVVFDTIFVSHGYHMGIIGSSQLVFLNDSYSALGPGGIAYAMPYTLIIISIGLLIGGGISSRMTRQKSHGDEEGLQKSMNSFLPTVIIIGAVTSVILFFSSKFLIWMGSGFQPTFLNNWFNNPMLNPDWSGAIVDNNPNIDAMGQLFTQASWYLRIQALGAIPYIYMVSAQLILRVEGKANIATRFTLVSLITNIILDFTFINIIGLNLVGAAIATVIAQFAAAGLYFWYYRNKFPITTKTNDWKEAKENLVSNSKDGFSSMFLQLTSGIMLVSFTMAIGFVNYGDDNVISGYTASFQGYFSLFMFFNLIIIGTAQTMMPLVSYNNQIGDIERIKKSRNLGFSVALIFAAIVTVLILLFPSITKLFGESQLGIFYQQRISQILFLTFTISSLILMASIYFQMLGKNNWSMFILSFKTLLILPLALIIGFFAPWLPNFNTILPWIQNTHNGDYSLTLFWAVPIIEVAILPLIIYWLHKVNDLLSKNI